MKLNGPLFGLFLVLFVTRIASEGLEEHHLRNLLEPFKINRADPFNQFEAILKLQNVTNRQTRYSDLCCTILGATTWRELAPVSRNPGVIQDVLGTHDLSVDDECSEQECRFFASMTPLLLVQEQCLSASVEYITGLQERKLWALQMVDATGKVPDGILRDTLEIPLGDLIEGLDIPLPSIYIPRGNTKALGSMEQCLDVRAEGSSSFLYGKHCFNHLEFNCQFNDCSPERQSRLPKMPHHLAARNMKEMMSPRIPTFPGWISGIGDIPGDSDGIFDLFADVMDISWGQCIPSTCNESDLWLNSAILNDNLSLVGAPYFCYTEEEGDPGPVWFKTSFTERDALSNAIIGVLAFVAFLMLLGTAVDVYQQINPYGVRQPGKDSLPVQLIKCFSISSNGRKLLNTDSGGEGHLGCLNGIRTISMLWVILGHVYLATTYELILINPVEKDRANFYGRRLIDETILNALPSVDTFFFLSGLLVAYLAFPQLKKLKSFGEYVMFILFFYLHRYLRLTIPLAFAIALSIGVEPYITYGYTWYFASGTGEACRNNGYLNLLYLQNFVKQNEMCLGVTWYLANDMQFFLLSPLLLIPMHLFPVLGWIWGFVLLGLTTFIRIFLTAKYDLPPANSAIMSFPKDGFDLNAQFYQRPYTRAQPYIIGIMLGYILYKTKGKKIKIPHVLNVLLWQASFLTGIAVIYGLYDIRKGNVEALLTGVLNYTEVESCLYSGVHKIAWSLALSWVVFSCVKGYGGIINSFLSWGTFTVLARLTYFAYMIHYEVINMFYGSMDYAVEFNDLLFTYFYIGISCIVFGMSFVASLAFESPFIGLEKILIGGLRTAIIRGLSGGRGPKTVQKSDSPDVTKTKHEEATTVLSTPVPSASEPPTVSKENFQGNDHEVMDLKADVHSNELANGKS